MEYRLADVSSFDNGNREADTMNLDIYKFVGRTFFSLSIEMLQLTEKSRFGHAGLKLDVTAITDVSSDFSSALSGIII